MASGGAAVTPEIKIDRARFREHCLTLTEGQRRFAQHVSKWILRPEKTLLILSGGPGTGKSYTVRKIMDCVLVPQVRMSYTARSADGIGGRTIHSVMGLNPRGPYSEIEESLKDETDFSRCVEESARIKECFACAADPLVVIMEELSMINAWLAYHLITFFMGERTELPVLFICMGDRHQLRPIKSVHNLFSVALPQTDFEIHYVELNENKRFVPRYEKIIDALRVFVDERNEDDVKEFIWKNFPVVDDIDAPLLMRADRAMAFRNDRVRKWNSFYLRHKMSGPEIRVRDDNLVLKSGCIVFVTKNGCSTVANGTQLIFERYDPDKDVIVCRDSEGRAVRVARCCYNRKFPIELGFAGTVHKYQGDTIDDDIKVVICFGKRTDLNLLYTALSRVRKMEQILAVEF